MRIFLTIAISLITGLIIGLVIGEIPFLELQVVKKVRILSIFSIVITASAILAAPFITKRVIEDNRTLKETLLSDLNAFLEATNEIHDRYKSIYQNGAINDGEKHELIGMFDKCDRNLHALSRLIEDNCSPTTNELFKILETRYFT